MLKILFFLGGLILCINYWVLVIAGLFILSMVFFIECAGYSVSMITLVLCDNLSYYLIVLTFWIGALMIMGSYYVSWEKKSETLFLMVIMFMMMFLYLTFSFSDLLGFYIMFEASLIPIFLMVFGWGYQPERVSASYYLLFYTLFASLPLLVVLLWMNKNFGSMVYFILGWELSIAGMMMFFGLILAFLVKMPMYSFHLWLPKAHVEAPAAGSMILAGVLLKLGVYGLFRVLWLNIDVTEYSYVIMVFGVFGGLMASFVCLRQNDAKSLIAYSSVAHMGFVLAGLFSMSVTGWMGAFVIMIAHGLCSSGLFGLVGMVYSRMSTRSMVLIRGCITIAPLMTLWWFILCAINLAAPPTPNLLGEILVFTAMLGWSGVAFILMGLSSFFGAAYNLYLFSSTQHGNISEEINSSSEADVRELLFLFFHVTPLLVFLVLSSNWF